MDAVRAGLAGRVELIADDLPGHGKRRDEPFDFATAVGGIVAAARKVLAAGAQLEDAVARVVAERCTFALRGLAGAVARISRVPRMLIPPGAARTLIYRGHEAVHVLHAAGSPPSPNPTQHDTLPRSDTGGWLE